MHLHHYQGRFGRILGAMVLTAVLAIVAPSGADAAGRTGSPGLWRWLAGLWGGRIATLIGTPAAPAESPSPAIRDQDTTCPPTGCSNGTPTPTGTPGPGTTGQGTGTDPDGKTH